MSVSNKMTADFVMQICVFELIHPAFVMNEIKRSISGTTISHKRNDKYRSCFY